MSASPLEKRNAADFEWPDNASLYSEVRVRLHEPPHTALVGILTGKAERVNLNRQVDIPFDNVRRIEVIREHQEHL